ncbi:hypothetical protein [Mesorhizobium sp.]|uniref:hypothetical protein n=1 Tax=Mesorhizobium sp. TaxID=1871066 RepID=UPI00257DA162|nr:hypothetical protein [Mesorhizobium sp.]
MARPHRTLHNGLRDGWAAARLVSIDLARALAVFGMFAVHVVPTAAKDWSGV